MENFYLFLESNWKFLLVSVFALINLILIICKRKTKVNIPDSVLSDLFCKLPGWINDAESSGKTGPDKLKMVLLNCNSYVREVLGVNLTNYKYFLVLIESILSTPQKKGDINER